MSASRRLSNPPRATSLVAAFVAAVLLAALPGAASAFPAFGVSAMGDCSLCHDQISSDRFEVFAFEGLLDPPDGVGQRKYFTVEAGQAVDLSFRATNGEVDYAFQLIGTDDPDVTNGNDLIFLADENWDEWIDPNSPTYYTNSPSGFEGYDWNTSDPTEVVYTMQVNPATQPGNYLLVMSLAGRDAQRIGWYQEEEVYLEVTERPGTMRLAAQDLVGGQRATLQAALATPGSTVYFVYSTTGYGNTFVPQLNVTLGIESPVLGGSARADSKGTAFFRPTIPDAASGLQIWLQAAEAGNISNVLAETVG